MPLELNYQTVGWKDGQTDGQTTISLVVFNGKKPLKPKTHSKSQLRATGNAKWVTDKRPHAKTKKIFSSPSQTTEIRKREIEDKNTNFQQVLFFFGEKQRIIALVTLRS